VEVEAGLRLISSIRHKTAGNQANGSMLAQSSNSQLQWKLIASHYLILLISLWRALTDEILHVRIIVRSQRPRTALYRADA
jgi:hypothetical protein